MRHLRNTCYLVAVFVTSSNSANASPIVIAGSELNAPPAFWDNSFYPLTSRIARAFPFSVAPGGPYFVDELQIAAFYYRGFVGNNASFSIRENAQGEPGLELVEFLVNDISTTAQVHSLLPLEIITLQSDNLYWIVGKTDQGQVNWNLGDNTFGETAFRLDGGEWAVQQGRNVAAFAILGTPIPEPKSIALVGMIAFGVICHQKRGAM